MTRLVLIHGRDLDGFDPEVVEAQWLGALNSGLADAGSPRRLGDDDASFVFYGDALAHLTEGLPGQPPPVTVHALTTAVDARPLPALPDDELQFVLAVALEVLDGARVARPDLAVGEEVDPDERVLADSLGDALARLVVAALAAVDRLVPGLSSAVVLLLARDVYAYVHDDAVRAAIDGAVSAAVPADEPTVVVAHSLGSVVAYAVLAARAADGEDVPLLLTLGSPLGIRAVREALQARAPLTFPAGVRRWVNARDPRDVLALHDLTPDLFPLPGDLPGAPRIEALAVDNRAPGHHAAARLLGDTWAGYLADAAVAGSVTDALG